MFRVLFSMNFFIFNVHKNISNTNKRALGKTEWLIHKKLLLKAYPGTQLLQGNIELSIQFISGYS